MAKFVLTDASVTIKSVDLSDHVQSVTVDYGAAEVDVTTMGAGAEEVLSGLTKAGVTLTFRQDYDASSVDATLFSLVGAAAVAIAVKPTSGAVAATNPEYTGSVILTDYTPVSGNVGDVANATATFKVSGALARAVI